MRDLKREMLTQAQVNNWRIDPTTKKIRQKAEKTINDLKDQWVTGVFTTDALSEYARGRIAGLLEIFEIEGEDNE